MSASPVRSRHLNASAMLRTRHRERVASHRPKVRIMPADAPSTTGKANPEPARLLHLRDQYEEVLQLRRIVRTLETMSSGRGAQSGPAAGLAGLRTPMDPARGP